MFRYANPYDFEPRVAEGDVTGEFVTYLGVFKAHLYRCSGGDRSESTRLIICSFTYLFKSIA